ncbi:RagB/SusD family nutrient uptake outer membrane protein [Prevotella dentasini]|uniref:RagB/SusD family nutrient uptake outer membrane protein n=1 Tax=Prevotella dentasini TaxID=589537 RepID=UPI00046A8C1F|nr:RagB/SusD family nutrient uptake outer membrane protein [Prevotella dentasini]
MKRYIKNIVPVAAAALMMGLSSCVGDLDNAENPKDPNISTENNIIGEYNKCYANLALPGNSGANGDSDLDGYDGGTAGFVRQLWNVNELPTDEAICGWGDAGIQEFVFNSYGSSHPMTAMFYFRLTNGITYCNDYLVKAADYDKTMTAEVRFVRALHYFYLMDTFGNIPFSETTLIKPKQISRKEAYDYIEKELLDIEPDLGAAKARVSSEAGYGRANKAAAWMLLARLYLNAEVYTGTPQWEKAAKYAKMVMDSDYKLNTTGSANGKWSAYQMLFMGDNGESSAAKEIVFPILADGITTTSYGGSFFVIASTFDNKMHADESNPNASNGTTGMWAGNRARPDLLKKFFPNGDAPQVESYNMVKKAKDDRAIFWGKDRNLDNVTQSTFTDGYAVAKFLNFHSDGSATHDAQFPDMDYPLMRVAEAYLMYAEAEARLNGNVATGEAAAAINALRARAHNANLKGVYNLSDICDEWSREFYFEGLRRTTLVRFGRFGGSNDYNWTWKGGDKEGRNFEATRNIYAIPLQEFSANENLVQNPGY